MKTECVCRECGSANVDCRYHGMDAALPPVRSEALLSVSGRPLSLTTDTPTLCCGARLLIECDGTYRCPCGGRQERLAKATIRAHLLDTPNAGS